MKGQKILDGANRDSKIIEIDGCNVSSLIKGKKAMVLIKNEWVETEHIAEYIKCGGKVYILTVDGINYKTK